MAGCCEHGNEPSGSINGVGISLRCTPTRDLNMTFKIP
jgi:hypothetical protein